MRVVKIAIGLACGVTLLLLILACTVKSPEVVLYEETIELLMRRTGISSDQAVKAYYPTLTSIESTLSRIAYLKQIIQSHRQNPAPSINEEEALRLKAYNQSINQLRKAVRTELYRLIDTYSQNQP